MKLLALAYVADPEMGSEEGAGWIWSRLLGGIGETWILTRPWPDDPNRIEIVRAALATVPEAAQMHLVVVELPRAIRRLAIGRFRMKRVEYILWQFCALRAARRLHRRVHFDLVWHVSWSAGWLGSIGWAVGPAFVLGPIGVGVRPPLGLLPSLGAIGAASELVRLLIQSSAQLVNPLVRRSTDRASLILVQNRETLEWLPVRQRPKARVFSRVILQDSPDVSARPAPDRPKRVAVFAGRLLPWKGAHLAIMAMRYAPDWRLRIYGTGPDEARLRRLVARFGLSGRVTFEGWKPRNELMSELATEGSVMLFPSLHEEGGWVVQESVQIGLPVLCLDRGGPPALGGVAVHADRPGATSRRLAAALDGVAGQGAPRDSVRYLDPSRAAVRRILAEGGVTVP